MKRITSRYKAVLIVVVVLLIAFVAVWAWLDRDIEYPVFDTHRLYLVAGHASLVEVPLHSNPYQKTIVTKLDIDFYLMSVDSDGDRLYVSGGHTYPESPVPCGIYLVNPLDGTTELIYDSTGLSKFSINKIFCMFEDDRAIIVGVSDSEVVVIDAESKSVTDRIAFDISAALWGSVGDQLIAGFAESEEAMYVIDMTGNREFVRIENVTNMLSVRSSGSLPYKQNGTWQGLNSDLSSVPLSRQWVQENARYATRYPRSAIEDMNGNLIQLMSDELLWKTYMRYRGRRVGRIDTMVYDLCVIEVH